MATAKVTVNGNTIVDLTDATATADKILSPYTAYGADGSKLTGTASGGGSATLVVGALRPDAELVQSWTYDRYIVQDEGVTLPSYSTSIQTLKASATLATITNHDFSTYNYYFTYKGLAIPVYSSEAPLKALQYCGIKYRSGEIYATHADEVIDSVAASTSKVSLTNVTGSAVTVYNDSTYEHANVYNSSSGAYLSDDSVALSSVNFSIIVTSPALRIQGNSSYLASGVWACLEDIRYQYVIELWRAEKGNLNIDGFNSYSMYKHIIDCYNNGGTLT